MLPSPSRFCVYGVVSALTLVVCSATSVTASDVARRAYGQGVHLLYEGRLVEAIESFDLAAAEIQDARIYYFRGLAKRRLGQAEEAEADFRFGARLEAASGRQDVGRALQRIQGADRLIIERYRRNARQLSKSKGGRSTPRVVRAQPLPEPRANRPIPKVAVSEIPSDLPPDDRDPFASTATGLLGRGNIEKAALATAAEEPASAELANDQPLGSGFDEGSLADEPFPAEFADETEFGSAPSPSTPKKSGILGSVFRAVTKSALPASPEQGESLLNNIRGSIPLPGGPPSGAPGGPDTGAGFTGPGGPPTGNAPMNDQDPFAEPGQPFSDEPVDDDTNSDPFDEAGDDAVDPFGESTDDSTDPSGEPAGDSADPFGDANAEDPFVDEGDPFADDG